RILYSVKMFEGTNPRDFKAKTSKPETMKIQAIRKVLAAGIFLPRHRTLIKKMTMVKAAKYRAAIPKPDTGPGTKTDGSNSRLSEPWYAAKRIGAASNTFRTLCRRGVFSRLSNTDMVKRMREKKADARNSGALWSDHQAVTGHRYCCDWP